MPTNDGLLFDAGAIAVFDERDRVRARIAGHSEHLAANDVAQLTIALLKWLDQRPEYSGIMLNAAVQHLDLKRRRELSHGWGAHRRSGRAGCSRVRP